MKALLDFEAVRRLLPQDHPFIFVDRVLEFIPGERIVTLKNVTGSEPFFAGHFPGLAIMPGALIGEAIAQSSILLFRLSREGLHGEHADSDPNAIFVVGTTRTHFLHPVVPGDALQITVEFEKRLSTSAMVKGFGEVDGRIVVKSTLTLATLNRDALTTQDDAALKNEIPTEERRT